MQSMSPLGKVQPKDVHNETQCTDLFTLPDPEGGDFTKAGGHADYKGGVIICSGHENTK